jgi:Leucine-rich repeat (LRR) protein
MRHLLSLLVILALHGNSVAQNCANPAKYQEKIQAADSLIAAGNFSLAYDNYSAAQFYCRDSAAVVDEAKASLFQRTNRLRDEAETAKQEAVEAKAETQAALYKADKLIDAFYFYDDQFALAYDSELYFIDKSGDKVKKLGRWERAEQFDNQGFAKVVDEKSINYLLDTTGQTYRVAYRLDDLKSGVTALDLRGIKSKRFPKKALEHTQLRILLLDGEKFDFNKYKKLPYGIRRLSNLKILSLRYCQTKRLPNEIGQLTNLTSITLANNRLKNLPSRITQLIHLTELNCHGNNLTSLPAEIGQMYKLTSLDLGNNRLTSLPAGIGQLDKLTSLDLGNNRLTSLPAGIGQLDKLTSLDLGNNRLTSLPTEITQLIKLSDLELGDNHISNLPPGIGALTGLTSLNLGKNRLKSIPPEIGQLTNLTELNLSENRLTSLPPEIGQLTKIAHLNLSKTLIHQIPEEIRNIEKLEYLNLSNSLIPPQEYRKIKSLFPSCNIKYDSTSLELERISINGIPPEIGQLTDLTSLDLSGNKLTSLPPEIGQLTNLASLDLSKTFIHKIPEEIGNLRMLKHLYLTNTLISRSQYEKVKSLLPNCNIDHNSKSLNLANEQLTSLPPEIGQLTNLNNLDLRANPQLEFKVICTTFASYSRKIKISTRRYERNGNENELLIRIDKQKSLPSEVGQLTNLTELDLDYNELTSLPPEIGQLINLTELDLRGNELTSLPLEITQLTQLKRLDLKHNNFSKAERKRIRKRLPNCKIKF